MNFQCSILRPSIKRTSQKAIEAKDQEERGSAKLTELNLSTRTCALPGAGAKGGRKPTHRPFKLLKNFKITTSENFSGQSINTTFIEKENSMGDNGGPAPFQERRCPTLWLQSGSGGSIQLAHPAQQLLVHGLRVVVVWAVTTAQARHAVATSEQRAAGTASLCPQRTDARSARHRDDTCPHHNKSVRSAAG